MAGMIEYKREQERLKRDKCREFYLAQPDASIYQCSLEVNCSQRTAAEVRSTMAAEGLLPRGRNNQRPEAIKAEAPSLSPPEEEVKEPSLPPARKPSRSTKPVSVPGVIIDDAAMQKIATASPDLLDIDFDNLDDEAIRKRLLRGVIALAFRPGVHPDTQLAATQVWVKLKDMARAKELGPGKPKTRALAIERLTDMDRACGFDIAMESILAAFGKEKMIIFLYDLIEKETADGPTPSNANEAELPAQGSAPASSPDQGTPS